MRKDNGGDIWNIIAGAVIGAGVSAAFEVATQVIVEGKSFDNLNWKAIGVSAAGGAITGAASAAGLGLLKGAVDFSVNFATSLQDGNIKNAGTWKKAAANSIVATGLDYVCGKGGMKIASKLGNSKIGISTSQRHYMQKTLTRYQKKVHKTFSVFFSKLNYFVYSGASYNYSKSHSHH